MRLLCATTNSDKFEMGRSSLKHFDVELEQTIIDIDEIQHEDPTAIIEDKVAKAFSILKQPVVVTDDSWSITALSGFPGPYMKSINHWFEPEDFINLMAKHKNRQIVLHQLVAYTDGDMTTVFSTDLVGAITQEPRGMYGPPIMHVVTFPEDNNKTISEMYDADGTRAARRFEDTNNSWYELGKWLKEHQS